MLFNTILTLIMALATHSTQAQAKAVFAHLIVGNVDSYQPSDWSSDIALAQAAGIDGFALNIAADAWTDTALQNAYTAAGPTGFKLFISFDYAANPSFVASDVINIINTYKSLPAQYLYDNGPLVSTFEGTANAGDWPGIKSATGAFVVPSWTSAGPGGIAQYLGDLDGMLAWDAWPIGNTPKNTTNDLAWQAALGSKPYMMAVSPWFYADCYGKNWVWVGDDLWHDRWQQVVELSPPFVEILTWNDYGESTYVGPIRSPSGIPTGASRYVQGNPHDNWRDQLPYYIAAYKNSNSSLPTFPEEKVTFWYRTTPNTAGSTGGTVLNSVMNAQTTLPVTEGPQNSVFFDVLVNSPADVSVQIGSGTATPRKATVAGVNHFSIPFNGQTGNVTFTVSRAGVTVAQATGPAITEDCPDGIVAWNAFVGSSSAAPSNSSSS